jgi:hypothetical protein
MGSGQDVEPVGSSWLRAVADHGAGVDSRGTSAALMTPCERGYLLESHSEAMNLPRARYLPVRRTYDLRGPQHIFI